MDEALAGHASLIDVVLHDGDDGDGDGGRGNRCTVRDDGRGIPTVSLLPAPSPAASVARVVGSGG